MDRYSSTKKGNKHHRSQQSNASGVKYGPGSSSKNGCIDQVDSKMLFKKYVEYDDDESS